MKPQRAGIVGAGLMGGWHAHAIRHSGGRVVAVADPDPLAARALARKHHAAVHASARDMLAAGDLDVIHVCSPLPTHVPAAEQAIAAGIHVLVEKPLAPDAAATRQLLAAAAGRGVLLCPVHQFLFQDGVQMARRAPSPVGTLRHLEINICTAGADERPPETWDDILAEVLPHPLSLAQALLPGGVGSLDWRARRPSPSDLIVNGVAGGLAVRFLISLRARPTLCEMLLRGEAGTLHADLFHGFGFVEGGAVSRSRKILRPFLLASARLRAAGGNLLRRALRREPAYPGLRSLVAAFHAAAAGGGPPPIPPGDVEAVAAAADILIAEALPGAAAGAAPRRAPGA